MSEVNNALADVKVEGNQDPFAKFDKEKDTPAESPSETKPEADKPDQGANTEEKQVPFHEHPRWIEREEELKILRSELEEFKGKVSTIPPTDSKVPKWFSTLYGDNQEAWDQYSEHDKELRSEIKREVMEAQAAERQQAEEQIKYWDKWVTDEIGKLQSGGAKFDRNELIKVMLDFRPTDEKGNFDFKAGYKILETMKIKDSNPENAKARKQIADSVTRTTQGESKPKDYLTPHELRNKSWHQL